MATYTSVEDSALAQLLLEGEDEDTVQYFAPLKDRSPSTGSLTSLASSASTSPISTSSPHVWDASRMSSSPLTKGMTVEERKQHSLMQRRLRNRESMRRTRLRNKENLSTLREKADKLEKQFQALTSWDDEQVPPNERESRRHLQTKLAKLVQVRREQMAENEALHQLLQEKQKTQQAFQDVLREEKLDSNVREKLALLENASSSSHSKPHKQDATSVRMTLSPMELQTMLERFQYDLLMSKHNQKLSEETSVSLFGWQTYRHVDEDHQMHFELRKSFPHLTAYELMNRAWKDGIDLTSLHESLSPQFERQDYIQHLDGDAAVLLRDLKLPDEKTLQRTHYLLFRRRTNEGFVTGMQSIEADADGPTWDADGNRIVIVEIYIAIEFLQRYSVNPQTGELEGEYCELRWHGRTNYKSPQHAAENAVNLLMGVLNWENHIVGQRVLLADW